LSTSYKILSNILLSRLIPYADEILRGSSIDMIGQRLIRFSTFITYWRKSVHKLFIDFKKAYYSVRREVLYNILSEFRIARELIKMCFNRRVHKAKICQTSFLFRMA
jgi:hypothetical protein